MNARSSIVLGPLSPPALLLSLYERGDGCLISPVQPDAILLVRLVRAIVVEVTRVIHFTCPVEKLVGP